MMCSPMPAVLALMFVMLIGISPARAEQIFDHDYNAFSVLLQEHVVVEGPRSSVDYRALKAKPESLQKYLEDLSKVTLAEFANFTRDQKLAFLINSYNAFTLQLILDNYPIDSIRKIGGLFRNPWKQRFFTLLGKERHLDEIEHEMIRPVFKEPRIHFVLVCASKGCPPLPARAFTAGNLDAELEAATIRFLRDTGRNRYDAAKGELILSSIFKWYGGDFELGTSTIPAFVATRMTDDKALQKKIASGDAKIRFLDYDWSLNDVP
jgi:hypothetical protein